MTNAVTIIRSLVIYGLCLPLAIFLGYLLAMPMDMGSFVVVIVALSLPLVPVLLRWHHPLLVLSWNVSMVLFFLPGRPNLWIVMVALSLGISILQHILNRNLRFVHVPSVAYPLLFLLLVVAVTAEMTGGIGIKSLGGEAYGGKRYILVFAAIAGYFALTSRAVPQGQAVTYVAMYFLGAFTSMIGNLAGVISPSFYFIFTLFPVEKISGLTEGPTVEVFTRLGGVTIAAQAMLWFILALYGLRGLLDLSERWRFFPFRFRDKLAVNQPWRFLICLLAIWFALLGGYRSVAIFMALTLVGVFYLEGLFRTHLLPIFILLGLLLVAIGLPMLDKLPLTIQRSFAFLPVQIDPVARLNAESSSEWRLQIWREVIPTIPRYLLLGKGYSINAADLELVRATSDFRHGGGPDEGTVLAGDYHNGPLSLIIPLGIFGVIGFLWFLAAGFRLLLNNYRYGDPELRRINTFLLAYFAARGIFFFTVFGAFESELMLFTGLVGLSVSLNGGMRWPVPVPVEKPAFNQFRLARMAKS